MAKKKLGNASSKLTQVHPVTKPTGVVPGEEEFQSP